MPYEPHPGPPVTRPRKPVRRSSNTILGVAAIVCLLLSLFNLYVSYPLGVPPEFPLFVGLTVIFGILWLFTRRPAPRR